MSSPRSYRVGVHCIASSDPRSGAAREALVGMVVNVSLLGSDATVRVMPDQACPSLSSMSTMAALRKEIEDMYIQPLRSEVQVLRAEVSTLRAGQAPVGLCANVRAAAELPEKAIIDQFRDQWLEIFPDYYKEFTYVNELVYKLREKKCVELADTIRAAATAAGLTPDVLRAIALLRRDASTIIHTPPAYMSVDVIKQDISVAFAGARNLQVLVDGADLWYPAYAAARVTTSA